MYSRKQKIDLRTAYADRQRGADPPPPPQETGGFLPAPWLSRRLDGLEGNGVPKIRSSVRCRCIRRFAPPRNYLTVTTASDGQLALLFGWTRLVGEERAAREGTFYQVPWAKGAESISVWAGPVARHSFHDGAARPVFTVSEGTSKSVGVRSRWPIRRNLKD